ncbi:protein turtle homolog A [Tachysurus vachellii]|uniref:protein turtle homolog A n=1 Tax=Tachysurus vachellii TaxID=175792 RepID=UPI00296AFF8E|nr:protein turtle homolog A [Tachysurus vachellii]
MAMKELPVPGVLIPAAVLLCVLIGVGGEQPVLRVKQGGSALLNCPLSPPVEEVSSASLHVVEWVRRDYDIPILIKFGAHAPRVHPRYEGRVSLAHGTALRVKDLVLQDGGWYECRILLPDKSSEETRNGSWTLLSVTAPPVFTETPPSITEALFGRPITLKCVAHGNPPPTIVWYKEGVVINQTSVNHVNVMVLNGSLTFSSASRETAGRYQCQASNSEGNEIHTMQLRVKGPPFILIPPTDTVLNMSHNALLRCQAEADPPNMTYVWMRDGDNVYHIESLKSRVKVMVDGTLLISKLIPKDSGKYTCMPTNGLLTPPTASATLTVRHPAQVTQMPEQIFLPTGMRGVISCPLLSDPPLLRVDWTKNGKALDLNAYPGWILTSDGSVVITTANDDAVGVYTCTPYNSYGTMGQSEHTTVILQDPPSIALAPQKEYSTEAGRTLIVPCQAHGDPPPTVTWAKLSPSVSLPLYSVSENGSLLLQSVSKDHFGEWECSVTNRVSTVRASTTVIVLGTSPHAVSSVFSEVGEHQANVSWVPGFDGGFTQTFTVWLKCVCEDEEQQDWHSAPGPSSSTSVLVSDLLPSTEYQFSVMAHNKLGSGPFSNITTARTMDALPTSPKLEPPTLLYFNQSSEGVYLRWAVPSPQQLPIDSFVLQSRLEDGEWSTLDENINANKSEMLVQGLRKNSNYELRLLSRHGEQLSMPSHSFNISTLVMDNPSSRFPEMEPRPLWTGVMIGMGVLCLLLLVLLVTVCLIGRKRNRQHRKMMRDHAPAASRKASSAPDSPDSVLKQKLLPLRPLSSSSSSSDHSSLEKSNRNDYPDQKHHQLPRTQPPSHGSEHESHLRRSSTVDLIHRGPDGRFMLEGYEELSTLDLAPSIHEMSMQAFSRSSGRPGDATLRKSQSMRSYRSDRKHPPFVLSVDMPSCGLDISSGRSQTLPRYGCYSVSLGKEISTRSSLASEISGSVLYTPSDNCSTLKYGGTRSTASTIVLQMEHEKEQGNLSRCLTLAREREKLERELRKYTLDHNFQSREAEVKRGGSLRVESRREIEERGWKDLDTSKSLQVTHLSNRGQCLSSNTLTPRVRASSCIPWEAGYIMSPSNLVQTQNCHKETFELLKDSHLNKMSNQRRSKSLERGEHQRSGVKDQRRRRTITEGAPVNFDNKPSDPTWERSHYSVQGSLKYPLAYNHSQHHIFPRMSHLGNTQQGGKAEKSREKVGCAADYVEMCVDEPEIQAQNPLTRAPPQSMDFQRPSLSQLQMETERQSGYKTIQKGLRRDLLRMSSGSSRTLPSKHRQSPAFQDGLCGTSQDINHHKSAPSLEDKMYSEQFLPPDAWIDSLNTGQNSYLSPLPSGEENRTMQSQEAQPCTLSENQLQDSHHQQASNTASTVDQDCQHHSPPSLPSEDSSWPLMHCYSPEPEGSCRSYASHSSGRGSLDQPSSRQSLSFSPPLNSSLEIPEESNREEAGQRSLQECYRRDSVDENYEWDSHYISVNSTDLKTSISATCLQGEILSKGRQRSAVNDSRLALKQEKRGLYRPLSILPPSCEESLLEQEIQHGSMCYPDPDPTAEAVRF